jgi:hypothetical protein
LNRHDLADRRAGDGAEHLLALAPLPLLRANLSNCPSVGVPDAPIGAAAGRW